MITANDLEKFHGVVDFDFQAIENKISLREAARMFGNREKDIKEIEVSCNCNGECKDRRCSCFLKNITCKSHCHLKSKISKNCINK